MERQDRYTKASGILSALHRKEEKREDIKENTEKLIENVLSDVHSIWDSGDDVADRYTVVLKDGSALGVSEDPTHPQGFSQWDHGVKPGGHLGKKISFNQLPRKVQKHVKDRLKEGFEMIEVVESKENTKPLTFKEVVKNNKGKEDVAIKQLVGNILASSNSEKIFMQVAKVLKNPMKDTDALGYDAATGQEVSKGAIKEAFRKYLGL